MWSKKRLFFMYINMPKSRVFFFRFFFSGGGKCFSWFVSRLSQWVVVEQSEVLIETEWIVLRDQ